MSLSSSCLYFFENITNYSPCLNNIFAIPVFEDNIGGPTENYSLSEKTVVLDSTPKPKRKMAFEGSPLSIRNRKFLQSRTGSLDTLSPCESIASDDLMMDYDYSQSSGMEDLDR